MDYYFANRDKILERQHIYFKKYYEKNKERLKQKVKQKFEDENNCEQRKLYFRDYTEKNKDKIKSYQKLYYQNNTAKIKDHRVKVANFKPDPSLILDFT